MISNEERAKRFKDARTIHNRNGEQTLKQVKEATGIQASMISDLETSAGEPRPVGYPKIVALADYYGVNVAWLMGQDGASWSIDENIQTAIKTTGLSEKAVDMLQIIKGKDLTNVINRLVESKYFAEMLYQFNHAMIINANNTQPDEVAELIENLQAWGIDNGMDSNNSRLSNRQLIDLYRRKAVESINKAFVTIMREDKEDGKRSEENQ